MAFAGNYGAVENGTKPSQDNVPWKVFLSMLVVVFFSFFGF